MFIDSNGRKWFKGNIHTHTTCSDGVFSPDESAALYRRNGYDFLAITDHWKMSENKVTEDGLLLLSGCEYDLSPNVIDGIFHVTALGCDSVPNIKRGDGPLQFVREIHRCGGIANFAHPAWSMNTCEQLLPTVDGKILPLYGADVTEIYNSVSDLPRNCRPYSGAVLDIMAARGHFTRLAAADDTHWYGKEACLSYIMVAAEECTREAILAAISRGDFFATQGPTLEVTRDGDTIRVTSSPVESVVYFTDTAWCSHRTEIGSDITNSSFKITNETFVRVEVCDKAGRYAWSQYIVC